MSVRRSLAAFSLFAGLLFLVTSAPARATGVHDGFDFGISLQDLVDGATFDSGNGELTFSGFTAEVSGVASDNLDLYRVIPTDDGFKIFSPLGSWFGKDAALNLGYDVDAADGKEIVGMSMSFLGIAFGNGAAGAMATVFAGDEELGMLAVGDRSDNGHSHHHGHKPWLGGFGPHGKRGPFGDWDDDDHGPDDFRPHGKPWDSLDLEDGYAQISVLEKIFANAGGFGFCGGFGKVIGIDHSFETRMIPEPGTALLLGLAALGLRGARRRRS